MMLKYYLVLCCAVFALAEEKYTDKYDKIDLDEILENKRLLQAYVNCILDKGKCTPEGKELKDHLEDALQTGCEKCTEAQKKGATKVIEHLIKNELPTWHELTARFDPEGKYKKIYEERARANGIQIPDFPMKALVVIFVIYLFCRCNAEAPTYTTKYDGIDLDEILASSRLLTGYVNCLMDLRPCTPDGKELKKNLPDAISNDCSKCTERQQQGADKVMHYIIDHRPDDWEKLEKKYNSDGSYKRIYLESKVGVLSKTKHSRKTANREYILGIQSHTKRSFLKPIKNMASTLIVLLSLVLAVAIAVPIPQDDAETTTVADVQPLYAVVEVIEDIPVLVPLVGAPEVTTEAETKEPEHKVARRSLRVIMANPRKFSEKIALHNQKQAEETAAFEKIMREVSDATNKVNTSSRRARVKAPKPVVNNDSMLRPSPVGLGSFRSGSLPNVAAPQASAEPENTKVVSPPPDSNWRRTNSDSALHQSCGGEQPAASQPLSPHHPLHSHAHPHSPHQNHRRAADIHLDVLGALGMNPSNRPRSSCEIPRIPNNNNVYESGDGGGGGGGGGGLACGELQVPGGSLPDLTSVHFPPPHYLPHPHRTDPDYQTRYNMSPLDHSWISSSCYQTQCSPPSQYSSTSNINIPSPTMVHSPGSPAESPQTDYNNLHQALLQPFEQITMLDSPVSSYNTTYMNHSSPQTTNSQHTYPQSPGNCGTNGTGAAAGVPRRGARDPVPGGGYALPPLASPAPATPPSIPDIILTDYSGELDPGIFGGEEAQLRAGLDLDDLTLLEEPSALLPDSAVEHELLDRFVGYKYSHADRIQVSKDSSHGETDTVQARPSRNEYLTQNGRAPAGHMTRRNTYDNFAEYKTGRRIKVRDEDAAIEEPEQPYFKRRQPGRFASNNYGNDQLLPNPEASASGFEDNPLESVGLRNDAVNRRRNGARLEDDGEILFENGDNKRVQVTKVMKNEPNDFNAEPSGQSHFYKKYYNPLRSENIEFEEGGSEENQEDSQRDRREVQQPTAEEPSPPETKENKELHNIANEDDQAAIKRHIKKLSSEELDELLNSLSEEKKALLQKIIETDASNENNNLNKREITKKAGAVEENNFLDGGALDTNKISGPTINLNTDGASQNTETTENINSTVCPNDIGETSTSKNSETSLAHSVNKESTNNIDENAQDSAEDNGAAATAELATSKNENKREVNLNDFNNEETLDNHLNPDDSQDALNDQSYVCSQDEDLSQLMDDEEQLHYDVRNTQKRDTEQENDANLSKSLQESFPNSNSYDDSGAYAGSDMAPLIRVKRRNKEHAVKKRAAAIMPIESKVAYVPYRAENEDEDSDEGNEFYDDGFFDRTANFAKNVNKLSDSRRKTLRLNADGTASEVKQSNLMDNIGSDTMSIGSDTDNVLSGVEGVDDNLMFNGAAREKRSVEKGSKLELADDLIKEDLSCSQRSTTVDGSKKSESFSNLVNYDGNEAFGPIPKSYDGELGRYKRIRRLKQSVNPDELSSPKTTGE
ncbi:hypothetical protein MSG28_008747 [Choristoneura fumiferana]|uniref:Uncharacterized protein n=1 Tax=Choristoneura fumiferana TaxID=7141 RepID=A0ACC0J7Z7_CHOFU|nr:hypothetical protein MSG28_008747 [Choristoneura fumiferana]